MFDVPNVKNLAFDILDTSALMLGRVIQDSVIISQEITNSMLKNKKNECKGTWH